MSWVPGGLESPPLYQELGAHTSRWQMVAARLHHVVRFTAEAVSRYFTLGLACLGGVNTFLLIADLAIILLVEC